MHRKDVRKKLGGYREFRKSKSSMNTTDDFGGRIHAYYDKNGKLNYMEFPDESSYAESEDYRKPKKAEMEKEGDEDKKVKEC